MVEFDGISGELGKFACGRFLGETAIKFYMENFTRKRNSTNEKFDEIGYFAREK